MRITILYFVFLIFICGLVLSPKYYLLDVYLTYKTPKIEFQKFNFDKFKISYNFNMPQLRFEHFQTPKIEYYVPMRKIPETSEKLQFYIPVRHMDIYWDP
ncbi:MAG: hypothetical protein QXD48_01280 [Candidatus Aenigmatarchaeota archaeon]